MGYCAWTRASKTRMARGVCGINITRRRALSYISVNPFLLYQVEVSPFQDQLPFKTRALLAPATI